MRSALVVAALASGCVVTLPFDELSGGMPRPIAHWSFEEGSGLVAADRTGTHQGVLEQYMGNLPTWTREGKRGGGLAFTAFDGWVSVPTLSGAGFPLRATFAAWIRLGAFPPDGADLLEIDDDSGPEERTPVALLADADGVFLIFGEGGPEERVLLMPAVPLGTWTLVAAGWDIPAKSAFLYVRPEGASARPPFISELPPGFALPSGSLIFMAGGGTLDEARIFDRLLSSHELDALD